MKRGFYIRATETLRCTLSLQRLTHIRQSAIYHQRVAAITIADLKPGGSFSPSDANTCTVSLTATVVLSRVTPAVVPEEEDEVLARCTT